MTAVNPEQHDGDGACDQAQDALCCDEMQAPFLDVWYVLRMLVPAAFLHPTFGEAMSSIRAIIFDLYGTLFDVHSVANACESAFPGRGMELSVLWRQKQLEYTWLRSMMRHYVPFEAATADALAYSCERLELPLDAGVRDALCDAYLRLSPFPETLRVLRLLGDRKLPLAILSNGSHRSIESVVVNSGITQAFVHLLSVDEVKVFKPDPRVYELGERALGVQRSEILFVSSNAWDATGAGWFGYQTAWVNRGALPFEVMGHRPTHVATTLEDIVRVVDGEPAGKAGVLQSAGAPTVRRPPRSPAGPATAPGRPAPTRPGSGR